MQQHQYWDLSLSGDHSHWEHQTVCQLLSLNTEKLPVGINWSSSTVPSTPSDGFPAAVLCGFMLLSHLHFRKTFKVGLIWVTVSWFHVCVLPWDQQLLEAHLPRVKRHLLSPRPRVKSPLRISPVRQRWWITDSDCNSWQLPDLLLFGRDDPMQPWSLCPLCWAYTALSIGYPKTLLWLQRRHKTRHWSVWSTSWWELDKLILHPEPSLRGACESTALRFGILLDKGSAGTGATKFNRARMIHADPRPFPTWKVRNPLMCQVHQAEGHDGVRKTRYSGIDLSTEVKLEALATTNTFILFFIATKLFCFLEAMWALKYNPEFWL